ncbi:Peptidase C65, otubain [Drechmeria coniospora]|uniref:Peptidase C65, otubain n=1 Tax=Drechmeria coniospora TaxID=98403 RepID=A0A151GLL7_DRECN|nr:Peptidase C65, otubain [Drechmeria coniospora]KYK57999.1 Peptidase C65, otubain [Drechmeria coniospora]
MSLNHTLSTVGGYSYFEDWADEMTGLLRELAAIVTDGPAAHGLLLQRWNDAAVEGGLIYYLRLLAATYLKANASTYDPFVPDGQGVQAYCSQSVELVNREIEHLGIVALANILLKPAGIALEIAYLDRSPGGRVNNHRFADEGEQVIYLLYRPDHYDILYRAPAARPVAMQVRSLSHDVRIAPSSASLAAYSSLDLDVLAMIPGFTAVVPLMAMPTPEGPEAEPLAPTDGASPWPPTFLDGPPTPVPPLATTSVLARCPLEAPACPIRFSPVQLEYDESNGGFGEANFQAKTSAFKNSVWNRAHYGNSHFHPEEWTPLDEDKGKRRRAKDA